MSWARFIRSVAGQWTAVLMGVSLVVAPFGCPTADLIGADLAGGAELGFKVNSDPTSSVLMSLGPREGTQVFVFGTRGPSGVLEEVSAISVRAADGTESFITFESGRPVHVEGPDGSYVHLTYQELGPQRLRAAVELYAAPEGTKQSLQVEIDPGAALENLARALGEVTGQELAVVQPEGSGGRAKAAAERHNTVVVLVPVVVVPFTAVVSITSLILAQVFLAAYKAVVGGMEAVIITVMFPFLVLAELTQASLFLPAVMVDLLEWHGYLPDAPIVILR